MACQDLICLSLESWDDVWRRNQFFARELLAMRPGLRLLFVEPPVDVTWSLARAQRPAFRPLHQIGDSGRLWAVTPRKWLPRRLHPGVDRSLGRQVLAAARSLQFHRPVLWINDSNYSGLTALTQWPTVYDITDDWLLAANNSTTSERLHRNELQLLNNASQVVVCSPNLVETKSTLRDVHLIPNAVDLEHFRRHVTRPADLPPGPVALYVGTLVDGRLDVDLCKAVCDRLHKRATLVLVGPNCLSAASQRRLGEAGAVMLGARPYQEVPAYMQHADVLVVPHLINPFTESLDPIKARELLAVGRPTVSTPVAGFRDLSGSITVAKSDQFVLAVDAALARGRLSPGPGPLTVRLTSWTDRAKEFLSVLDASASSGPDGLCAVTEGSATP